MVTKKTAKSQLGIYLWFLCVITVLCLTGVVAWLSLTPKNPNFRISNAHFPSLDSKNQSSHRNASVPVPNNSIIFDLWIFNPNKRMGIYYSAISLALYGGGGVVVGTNYTPDFYQGYKGTTMLQILIHGSGESWQGVNGGDLDFMVRVEADVKFRIIKWKTKMHRVVYEERFRKVKINLNVELQNASKVKIRN